MTKEASGGPLVLSYPDMLNVFARLKQGDADWKDVAVAGAVAALHPLLQSIVLGPAVAGPLLAGLMKTLGDFGGFTDNDAENVSRLIKSGKENDVDEMSIEMERDQWLGLKGKLDGSDEGVDVGFGMGGDTGYRIDVKYK